MKYERITREKERQYVMTMWKGDPYFLKIYNRLAELEDKIERGELIERTSEEYSAVRKQAVKEFVEKKMRCSNCGGTNILRQESPNKVEWWCEECGECIGSVHGDPVGAPGTDGAPATKNINETFSRPSSACNKERTMPRGKVREHRRQKR